MGRRIVNKEDLVAEERRPEREGELPPRAPLFTRSDSVLCPRDCLESQSDPLTDTSTTPDDIQTTPAASKQLIGHEGQRTLLRPSGGFPPGPARFPPNLFQFKQQKIFFFLKKKFPSFLKKKKKKKK